VLGEFLDTFEAHYSLNVCFIDMYNMCIAWEF
jgi:hypothetical protein